MSYIDNLFNRMKNNTPLTREAVFRSTETAENSSSLPTLAKGQLLSGEVTNLINRELQILLNDGSTLNARLDAGISLAIGQQAKFEVLENENSQILLRLINDTSASPQEAMVSKALDSAGLPATEHNVSAVEELLNYQQSIDTDSIHMLLRQSAQYKNASLSTLVIMNKYNIPVNSVNTTQFEAYRNFEHRILNQIENIGDTIINMLSEDSGASDSPVHRLLSELLLPSPAQGDPDAKTLASLLDASRTAATVTTATDTPVTKSTATNTPITGSTTTDGLQNVPVQNDTDISARSEIANTTTHAVDVNSDSALHSGINTTSNTALHADTGETAGSTFNADTNELSEFIKSNPEYSEAIKYALTEKWTFSPKELLEDKAIDKFYEQLEKDMALIKEYSAKFEQQNESAKTLSKTASAVSDNVDFLKIFNQLFTYVQLPMRLTEDNVHSELYVFTKKEQLKKDASSVSCLLHLDMNNLGPLDIYLELTGHNVHSKIYPDGDESANLIGSHIDELKKALEDKGFSLETEILKRHHDIDIVKDFMAAGDNIQGVKMYTFDVRA